MANEAAGAQGGTGTASGGASGAQGGGTGSYTVNNDGGGSGASAQGGARGGAGAAGGSAREAREAGAQSIVDRLVQRYGGVERALDVLSGELFDMREERREHLQKLAQLPPNGAVVLVGDDAKAWDTYKALNLPPATVKERLAKHDELVAESQRNALGTAATKAAAAVGYKNPALLGELLHDKGLQLDMRDTVVVQADGKTTTTVQMPYVRKAGDTNGHYTALADYFNAHLSPYVTALNTAPQGGAGTTGTGSAPQGAQGGAAGTGAAAGTAAATGASAQGAPGNVVVFGAAQQGGQQGGGGATDPVAARIAANAAASSAGNALRPAATK